MNKQNSELPQKKCKPNIVKSYMGVFLSIPEDEPVRLKTCGNVYQVMYSPTMSTGGHIIKLDKDRYFDMNTGEIKEFEHLENRSQDIANIARSIDKLRDLLNTNIVDIPCCRWLTLTYAENMTNPKKLMNDFQNFNKRCREKFGHYEYIACAEPQGRGAWHLHVVLIFPGKAPYMANSIVADCWKQGFVTIKKLDNVDNVGAYLTAYLGDVDLETAISEGIKFNPSKIKDVEVLDDTGQHQSKKYIKGARLSLYPPGFHLFRCSKGIKQPLIEHMTYKRAKEKIGPSLEPTFKNSVMLSDDITDFSKYISYEYYNKLRPG